MHSSIFLIQSQDPINQSFGTGFVIHLDEGGAYILTCAHVIEQVVEPLVKGIDVTVVSIGSSETIDLALLYLKGVSAKPFTLKKEGCLTKDVQLIGHSFFNKTKYQEKTRDATILGNLVKLKGIKENTVQDAWQIIAKDNYEIEHGNSGGPLLCSKSGDVMAVVSNNKGVTEGYAIDINHLKDIWEDIPLTLLWEKESRLNITFITDKGFKIFVSYVYSNREEEEWLLEFLHSIGNILEKGFDEDNFFLIDYQINSNIKENILDADIFLVLLSNSYVNNRQYLEELQTFKSNFSNTIILEYEKTEKPKEIENIKSIMNPKKQTT